MTGRPPAVSHIPARVSFVDALAHELLRRFPDPLALSTVTLLLPTRRACRALCDVFLRARDGKPLLLPRMRPLGDLDAEELLLTGEIDLPGEESALTVPPAMPSLTRQLLLTRAILQWSRATGGAQAPTEDQAARLADELARLLEQVETEGCDFAKLEALVPADYAVHWQQTLSFLRILTDHWPAIQAEQGGIGPAERRRRLHETQIDQWLAHPPNTPVIAAGSTGSIPSTARLLATIARLPAGEVVLPGLDLDSDEATWGLIGNDPTHPQYGLARLLCQLDITRAEVRPWPIGGLSESPQERARLVNAALRPAAASDSWQGLPAETDAAAAREALAGLRRVDCADPGEEALVVALILRRALEDPKRTAALVTPDRRLARRTAAELRRWGIEVDDSAGQPLTETPPGQFLRLTAQMIEQQLAPLPLLACLKHPLAAGGLAPARFRALVRRLETAVLRGPRPAPGIAGLQAALAALPDARLAAGPREELQAWLSDLAAWTAPFEAALRTGRAGLADVVEAHLAFAETLADDDAGSGTDRLWAGEAGEALAEFAAELREAVDALGPAGRGLDSRHYPGLLDSLLSSRVVRPRFGRHPRISVLGPLEARLQRPDVLVLGALNDGTWPAETDPGPWLSRPMRADFGLPPVERRIGLSAHDFTQAVGAPEVYLTRAERVDGAPSVPSRWLLRLDALLQALGLTGTVGADADHWRDWARALDRPPAVSPCPPPEPRPPLAARPRRLSVTRVETWMRDPYALYAREVLRLRRLDPLDADPGAAERGILVHSALERFLRRFPDALPDDAEAILAAIGEEVFAPVRATSGVYAFWMPRFRRIATWVVAQERRRRVARPHLFAEVPGALALDGFTLTAVADRIERRGDGTLAILDYKTGQPPQPGEVALGLAPQLPLEAAMAQAGAFDGVAAGEPAELLFWRLSGGEPAGEEKRLEGRKLPPPDQLAATALDGLRALIARFDDPATPYHALPRPARPLAHNDYAHLARVKEWATLGEGGEP